MSMLAEERRVSAAELAALMRGPSDIFWYLHGTELGEVDVEALRDLLGATAAAGDGVIVYLY